MATPDGFQLGILPERKLDVFHALLGLLHEAVRNGHV